MAKQSALIELYAKSVRRGKRTLEQVPECWREDVKKVLEEDKEDE